MCDKSYLAHADTSTKTHESAGNRGLSDDATACPDCQLTVPQSCLAPLLHGDILKPENKRVLEKHLANWAEWSRILRGVLDVRRSLLYLAIASLIVVIVHRTRVISVPSKAIPIAEVSGKNWHYD